MREGPYLWADWQARKGGCHHLSATHLRSRARPAARARPQPAGMGWGAGPAGGSAGAGAPPPPPPPGGSGAVTVVVPAQDSKAARRDDVMQLEPHPPAVYVTRVAVSRDPRTLGCWRKQKRKLWAAPAGEGPLRLSCSGIGRAWVSRLTGRASWGASEAGRAEAGTTEREGYLQGVQAYCHIRKT
jgi:hypothetical protein